MSEETARSDGAPARRAACRIVSDVLDTRAPLDAALARRSAEAGPARAFVRALATTVLRRLGRIDAILATRLAKPLPPDAGMARAILRVGAAELLYMDTPAYAAVSTAVDLARADKASGRYAGLINAVLRRIDRERDAALLQGERAGDWPAWLTKAWRADYGDALAQAISAASAGEAALDVSVIADPEDWARRLEGSVTPTGSVRVGLRGDVTELDGFEAGGWWVQDAAAALPARLLGPVAGLRVLDLCAAPGGKTMQLAAAGADVTALDKEPARVRRLDENLARAKLQARSVVADALTWEPEAPFDAVLLDAPCSATGTLRRRPDAAWRRGPEDVAAMQTLQKALLARAADWMRPGGLLVYCTCSLQKSEGELVAAGAPTSLVPAPITPEDAPGLAEAITPEGWLRTHPALWPESGGLDGFFVARYRRAG